MDDGARQQLMQCTELVDALVSCLAASNSTGVQVAAARLLRSCATDQAAVDLLVGVAGVLRRRMCWWGGWGRGAQGSMKDWLPPVISRAMNSLVSRARVPLISRASYPLPP